MRIKGSRSLHALLYVAIFAAMSIPAKADSCVQASADVVDGATIRAAPTSGSAVVGKLRPNEQLAHVATIPNWYEARLANGQSGFVSKRWSDLADCAQNAAPASTTPAFELHVIDVGTGLAVLVRGPDFTLIEDFGSNDDLARGEQNRAIAYLKTLNPPVTNIQHVILTHPHRDHVELLPDVFERYSVESVWNSGAFNDICGYRHFLSAVAAHPGIRYHTANQDSGVENIELGAKNCYGANEPVTPLAITHAKRIDDQPVSLGQNASMVFLYADGSKHAGFNENSLVVRLDLGSHRVLLMGDAEAGGRSDPSTPAGAGPIEGKLLTCCASDLKAEVLVIAHHGSKSSSRASFLKAVGARLFVISSGPTKYAQVTLPDPEVVAELKPVSGVFRTDIEDDECLLSPDKMGPDSDGKPGGCDNVVVTLPAAGPATAEYRRISD